MYKKEPMRDQVIFYPLLLLKILLVIGSAPEKKLLHDRSCTKASFQIFL